MFLLSAICCQRISAQLFSVDGGQGIAGEPSGGRIGFDTGRYKVEGSVGTGDRGIAWGTRVSIRMNPSWTATVGDQSIDVGVPADPEMGAGVLARGTSLHFRPTSATEIRLFGGAVGDGFDSGSVLFTTPNQALGGLSIDHFLGPEKRTLLFGRLLFGSRQTALGGVLYKNKSFATGLVAGIGSNEPHGEALLRYGDEHWDMDLSYRYSGPRFQLLTLPQFRVAQEDRENIALRWSPLKAVSARVERHQYIEPTTQGSNPQPPVRGWTNSGGMSITASRIGFGGDLFESRFQGIYASAASGSASLRASSAISVRGSYNWPLHTKTTSPILAITGQERLTRSVTIAEFATHQNGRWNVSYGGTFRSNRGDVNIGYSTVYLPLRNGGGGFQQQMNLSAHLRIWRLELGVQTFTLPDGTTQYGYEMKTYFERGGSGPELPSSIANTRVGIPPYVIRGQVVSEGTVIGVADVPVRIGDQTVYSDEHGNFSLHVWHKRRFKLALVLDRPIGSHFYTGVTCPVETASAEDGETDKVRCVIRKDRERDVAPEKGGIIIDSSVERSGPNPR